MNRTGLSKLELKELLETYPWAFEWDETDDVFNVSLILIKWKWVCENCNNLFDDPEWLESPSSENPICPKCESLNIDLVRNVVKHNPWLLIHLLKPKEETP